jgi:hypothetical protein
MSAIRPMCECRLGRTITSMSTTTFITQVPGPAQTIEASSPALTLRYAHVGDAAALDRLAQLDSAHAPRGIVLVAEVTGELWAAVSLDDPRIAVADPFRPTAELVALLAERARQLRSTERRRRHLLPRVWPDAGWDRAALN